MDKNKTVEEEAAYFHPVLKYWHWSIISKKKKITFSPLWTGINSNERLCTTMTAQMWKAFDR